MSVQFVDGAKRGGACGRDRFNRRSTGHSDHVKSFTNVVPATWLKHDSYAGLSWNWTDCIELASQLTSSFLNLSVGRGALVEG